MNTAKLIKKQTSAVGASQWVCELDPPLNGNDVVVVSAVNVPYSGPETYIFAADRTGEVLDWSELDGSFRGDLDHAAALRGAGYEVQS